MGRRKVVRPGEMARGKMQNQKSEGSKEENFLDRTNMIYRIPEENRGGGDLDRAFGFES